MILDEIIQKTKEDLEIQKKELPFDILSRTIFNVRNIQRDVKKALKSTNDEPFRLICEVKKASPSKGIIRENFDPVDIASIYQKNGANALSILTEPHFFKGNLEYLSLIRKYTSIPLLRKDFIVDEYQVLQAYLYGADFILLIAKALDKKELKKLVELAFSLGIEVLLEAHDKEDITKAIFAGVNIIGINHRDLQTFDMHMDLCEKLIPMIPNGKIIVAESGLSSHEGLVNLNKIGVDAFLIGEYFMKQDDIAKAIKYMKG